MKLAKNLNAFSASARGRLVVLGTLLLCLVAAACIGPTSSLAASAPIPQWVQQSPAASPSASFASSMAYDPATGEMVLFGGGSNGSESDETWTYDGSEWTKQTTTESPSVRHAASMAYDPATGKMVLFGGASGGGYTNDTWTYDGTEWTEQEPSHSPSVRDGASMAYDPATGQMVLFGGFNGSYNNETWTYDGSEWTKQTTTESPSVRNAASMAYDPATGQMVLFGGVGNGVLNNETWTYDGSEWTKQITTESPSARFGASMAYDPATGQMVLFGGVGSGGYSGETWTYDGSEWAEQPGATSPPGRNWASMAFDPATGQMVLFGGQTSLGVYSTDTWTYGVPSALPSEWIEKTPTTSPPALNGAGMAFDPATGETVLFGGRNANTYFGKTWVYDGEHWMEKNVAQSPSPRWSSAMAFDPAIGKIVLFGGADANGYLNETWVYEGETWKKLSPLTSPTPRYSASMAYDPAIGRMVLFGGYREFEPLEETWTFDGTTWTLANPTTHPSGRPGAGMDFDPQTGRMTLFGGQNPNTGVYPNETWTYKDANWAAQSTATSPPGRRELSMVFDPAIGKMVMFGGAGNPAMLGDTWTYDEGNWTKESPLQSPSPRFRAPSTFDEATGQVVLFGGSESTFYSDTWVYQQVKASPSLTAAAFPAGVMIGASTPDTATLADGVSPTGTVTFIAYGPNDADCSGEAAFTESVAVSGNGEYQSEFTPTEAGTYQWVVEYSGDANNEAAESPCEEEGETSTVAKATPTISTTASGATVGGQILDEATVSGRVAPTEGDEVEFKVYGPDDTGCENGPVETIMSPALQGSLAVYTPTEAGTYYWTAKYMGDVNNEAVESPCEASGETSTVGKAAPTLSTNASPGITLSGATKIKDTATLSGGYSPSGTVTFKLYGPENSSCTGSPAFTSSGVSVSNASAESAEFAPTAPGTYRWTAEYSGDANNSSTTEACNGTNESVTVSKAAPTLSTTASGPVTVGAKIKDTATLSGGASPGGTIVFKLYAPGDSGCHNAISNSGPITVTGNDNYESGENPTSEVGAYHWTVEYSGDANNEAAESPCEASGETSTVNKAAPTLSTNASANITIGDKVKDTATLSGGYNPTGTVTFKLYGPGNGTCANPAAYTSSPIAVSGSSAESPEFTPTEVGTYRWVAEYSGDTNNDQASDACNGVNESVEVAQATPTISTTPGGPVTVGATIADEAKVEGRIDPQAGAGITFKLYAPGDATCEHAIETFSVAYPASGEPEVSSPIYTTTEAGTYHWSTIYSGDANNQGASSLCTEASVANKATPTISTTATGPVTVGAAIEDEATVEGRVEPQAGSEVEFSLYGPEDPTCSGSPLETFSVPYGASGEPAVASGPYTTTQAGAYHWTAEYTGDANNEAVESPCEEPGETSVVDKATPAIATTASGEVRLGALVTDKAAISGAYLATGSVVFKLYGPDDQHCTGTPAFTSSAVAVSGNGDYISPDFTPTETGTYRWVATYSGDGNNQGVSGGCGDANESVVVASPVCSPVQSQVGNYVPKEVATGAVPGVRARLKVPVPSEQEVQATLHFRLNGKPHSVDLGGHTLSNPGVRNFHVPLPGSLAKHLPLRAKVVLSLQITSTPRASLGCVEPTTSHRKLHTRVVRVLAPPTR
jgi:archaellin